MTKSKHITTRLTTAQLEKLERLAKMLGVKRNAMLGMLIDSAKVEAPKIEAGVIETGVDETISDYI